MAGIRPKLRRAVYQAIGTVAGQRVRQSLGTGDLARANELCALIEARLWKRHSYGEEAVRTFEEAALSYLEAGGERRFLPPLIRHFRGRVLGSIKPGEVQSAARGLYPNAAGATRNRQVIVPVRAVINHGASLGWCAPIAVDLFPVRKPRRVAVDRAWLDAFMAQADADRLPHLAAAILFMAQTGARVGEAVRVERQHVDLSRREVLLERTKTTEWEARYITRELAMRIAMLPDGDGPLFGYRNRWSVNTRMKAVCRRAGIPYVPPHQAGRHSFATAALASGASVREVMEAGGWKTARLLLETYAHAEGAGRSIAERFDDTSAAQPGRQIRQVTGEKGGK